MCVLSWEMVVYVIYPAEGYRSSSHLKKSQKFVCNVIKITWIENVPHRTVKFLADMQNMSVFILDKYLFKMAYPP